MPHKKKNVISIVDRKEAIRTACMLAQKGDVILIAGKGHETYQEINGSKNIILMIMKWCVKSSDYNKEILLNIAIKWLSLNKDIMLYYIFRWLDQFGISGSHLWGYISFRAIMAMILALIISAWFGERFIKYLKRKQIY